MIQTGHIWFFHLAVCFWVLGLPLFFTDPALFFTMTMRMWFKKETLRLLSESSYDFDSLVNDFVHVCSQVMNHVDSHATHTQIHLQLQLQIAKAQLQIASAFLPGRIAETHVSLIAKHLVHAVGTVSEQTGLISRPVAVLTKKLGEPCRNRSFFFPIVTRVEIYSWWIELMSLENLFVLFSRHFFE